LVPLLAADDQDVAESAGREERDVAALPLDHDVRAERRAVHGLGEVRPSQPRAGDELLQALHARAGSSGVVRRLPVRRRPSSLWRTKSVKVPPTSNPTRNATASLYRNLRGVSSPRSGDAEVAMLDVLARFQGGWRALPDDLAFTHHVDAVGDRKGQVVVLLDQQD